MADPDRTNTTIARLEARTIVALKLARKLAGEAGARMQLAAPLRCSGGDPDSLWTGPDSWLLVSRSRDAADIIADCDSRLRGLLHLAVDQSAGLAAFRVAGPRAREVVASGAGLDVRPSRLQKGTCCRTRLAQVAAVIAVVGNEEFEIFVDRSVERYVESWLRDACELGMLAGCPGTITGAGPGQPPR